MNKKQYITDAELVIQYQSGDASAMSLLVERWHKIFCDKAYWIVKDPDISKDIAQESWRTIIKSINKLKDNKRFAAWALRIVYSKSIDYLKTSTKERVMKSTLSYEKQMETINLDNDDKQLKQALLKAISELRLHQQVVIRLFYIEEYSLKEISEMLGVSIGTAKSRLFHAREKLKKDLNKLKKKYS